MAARFHASPYLCIQYTNRRLALTRLRSIIKQTSRSKFLGVLLKRESEFEADVRRHASGRVVAFSRKSAVLRSAGWVSEWVKA